MESINQLKEPFPYYNSFNSFLISFHVFHY